MGGAAVALGKLGGGDAPKILAALEESAKCAIKDFSCSGLKAEAQVREILSLRRRLAALLAAP